MRRLFVPLLVLSYGFRASAEPFPLSAERVVAPSRVTASEDSSQAIVVNPANLGYLPAAEGRWTYLRCSEDMQKIGCGHAFEVATPLLWDFATGFRLDVVQPPWGDRGVGVPYPYRGYDMAWATWALGYALSERVGLGFSLARSYSHNAYVNGLFGATLAASFRPSTHFGFAAIAQDLNGPSAAPLPTTGLPILDRSYTLSMAFRPTGRRAFEVGVDARYLAAGDEWRPRVAVGLDVPGVGRARGDVEVHQLGNDDRRSVVAGLGLEIMLDHAHVGGGALFGAGLGDASSVAPYVSLGFSGYRSTAHVRKAPRAVRFRVEKTPGTRGHFAWLRKLWALAEDPEVLGVSLELRTEPATSFAHAEELADALRVLRAHKKKSLCSLEDNGALSLYVCANADRVVIHPGGGLRYAGLKSQYFYLARMLSSLGVKAEFVRIGAHKSAPEQFMNERASETARSDHEDLLRHKEAIFVRNLAVGRHLSEAKVREATRKGPFVAAEARDASFVDGFAFDDELDRVMKDLVGQDVRVEKAEDETALPSTFGPRGKIAVLYVDGDIVDGRSQRVPLLDMKLVGSYTISDQIRALRDDSSVRAVVLRVESPGGSSMASDVMWRELSVLGSKKPLIVSMGSVAASGGYYIAAAGRSIFALPLTITGSIGIFYGKADLSGLLSKIGVNIETYRTTPRADAESLFRGFTPDEQAELQKKVSQFYDVFLDRVSKGRRMTKAEVDEVGQGRVWTGQQAFERRLVDHLGGLRHALDAARTQAGLPADAPIAEYPPPESSLLDKALKLAGASAVHPGISLPVQIRDMAKAVAPLAVYPSDTALARLEWAPVETVSEETP